MEEWPYRLIAGIGFISIALLAWVTGSELPLQDLPTARAHHRLLREFLEEHLGDGRAFPAYQAWERLDA